VTEPPEDRTSSHALQIPTAWIRRLHDWTFRTAGLRRGMTDLLTRMAFGIVGGGLVLAALGILALAAHSMLRGLAGTSGFLAAGRALLALATLTLVFVGVTWPLLRAARTALGLVVGLEVEPLTGRLDEASTHFRLIELRGHRALAFHVTFSTRLLRPGDQVRAEIRLRWQGSPPLRARLPHYRGAHGEAVARELAAPVGDQDDLQQTVGLLLPLRAVELPEVGVQPLPLDAVVTLRLGEERADFPTEIEFLPRSSDYAAPEVVQEPEDIGELAPVVSSPNPRCPVCGDLFEEPPWRCHLCETPHHRECWEWSGRCSTFACAGGLDLGS